MAAAYDSYDYPSYWQGRNYEHGSETIALKSLLEKIPKVSNILEVGAGYGRLTPTYLFRAKKIILADPSSKLLAIARQEYKDRKNIVFIQSKVENISQKIRSKSVDLAIMVRVMHHLENPEEALKTIYKILKPGGYLILEFANKSHGKTVFKEICKGNFTFPMDIFPKDIRSKKSIKKNTLPFINYHPDTILHLLKDLGFKLIEKRSVSNIRNDWFKSTFPLESLLKIEVTLQKPFSYVNFGPSIFVLVRKVG